MLIKISKGKTYADALENFRKEENSEAIGLKIVSVRATQKGDVLIVLILLDRGGGLIRRNSLKK